MRHMHAILVVLPLLLAVFVPGAAAGKEAWAVCSYVEDQGSVMDRKVFYESSRKGGDDAVRKAKNACDDHARKKGMNRYRCEIVGCCAEPGWMAIASYLRSGGKVAMSCMKETEEEAIFAAKKACGSGTCARLFTYEIK